MLDVDPQDLVKVVAPEDQQPVQALGPHRMDPTLRIRVRLGARTGVTSTSPPCERNTSSKLRENFASWSRRTKRTCRSRSPRISSKVAGLLSDPGAVRVGSDSGEVDPSGVEFDEQQHLQPSQPHRVDGEAGRRPRCQRPAGAGTPASSCSPPRRRVQPVAAERGSDRGGRDPYAKPEELALDALVAPPGVLRGEADDQLLDMVVQRWSNGLAMRVGPRA